jgi:hypothetical protein
MEAQVGEHLPNKLSQALSSNPSVEKKKERKRNSSFCYKSYL